MLPVSIWTNIVVHGVAEHVLAEPGDAGAAMPQHGVSFRRTIAAHDPDRLLAAGFALHFPHQIDQVRIHLGLLALAPVAQEPVQLRQRGLVVLAVALERDGDVFVGVDVMHRDGARVALGDRVLQSSRCKQENEKGETARIAGARRDEYQSFQARLPNRHWPSHVDALGEPPTAAPAAASNANAMLTWEGLTGTYATPPPTSLELAP
jgi:hypothetical protein